MVLSVTALAARYLPGHYGGALLCIGEAVGAVGTVGTVGGCWELVVVGGRGWEGRGGCWEGWWWRRLGWDGIGAGVATRGGRGGQGSMGAGVCGRSAGGCRVIQCGSESNLERVTWVVCMCVCL